MDNDAKGCLGLILKVILFYGLYCFLYWLAEQFIPGGLGTVVEVVMFIIITLLLIAAANN
jgi:hypothetical protein